MKILITGANGFVGRAISQILEEAEQHIIRVGGQSSQNKLEKQKINPAVEINIDITDPQSVAELEKYRQVSVLIHSAGMAHQPARITRKDFFKVNVEGIENIVRLAKKINIKRLILISSVAVYGNNQAARVQMGDEYLENAVCRPEGFYAESKLAGESAAITLCREAHLSLTILRPATVVGEGDQGNFSRLIKSVHENRFLWLGDGSNHKSLIYKDDLGRACLEIIRQSKNNFEILNVSAEAVSVREIMKLLNECLDRKVEKSFFSPDLIRALIKLNERTFNLNLIRNFSDILEKWLSEDIYPAVKFKDIYGFSPAVSAVEALRKECRWLLEEREPKRKCRL